jgi:hypothetical protein
LRTLGRTFATCVIVALAVACSSSPQPGVGPVRGGYLKIGGPHATTVTYGDVRIKGEPQTLGGVEIENASDSKVELVEVWAESDSPHVTVLDSVLMRPEENPDAEQIGGACGQFPPPGLMTHDPESFLLAPGERVWVLFQVRATGADRVDFTALRVTYQLEGRTDTTYEQTAEFHVYFQAEALSRCVSFEEGTRLIRKGPETRGERP